jgi:hypothetical protein
MNPTYFGYNSLTKPKTFTLSFDIRTIVTGIAVNLGIISVDQLEEIPKYRLSYFSGTTPILSRYFYDPRYAGMQPLRCVSLSGGKPFCTFRINEVFTYFVSCIIVLFYHLFQIVMFPALHHLGANTTYPAQCNCTTLTVAELSDKTHNCNVFRFLSGFMYFNGVYATSAGLGVGLLNSKFGGSFDHMIEGAHRAMFTASGFGQSSPLTAQLNSPASLAAAYDFCSYGGKTCSFLTFTSYDIVPTNWAISEYHMLVTNGACANTITPTAEAW